MRLFYINDLHCVLSECKFMYSYPAVCGAGKTEVLFAGVEEAFLQGKRICIATPRTDVVLELAPRLRRAFPNTEIAALYGDSDEKHQPAQLIISTTHQLFRFYQAFDVMIVDEVDAFPYSMDPSLQYAVNKAKKERASTIYLTATPSKTLRKSGIQTITIPARYHRHPIPVPKMQWVGNWRKQFSQGRIPKKMESWLEQRLQKNIPVLLFLPSISLMEEIESLFPQLHMVHSKHPNRKELVQALRNQEIPGLLTTTILERGVTIQRLEVAVIGSEHEVFSESALVQIAGRVGRSSEHPSGDITFFHYGKTKAMINAVYHINKMNTEAKKRGFIDD